MTTTALLRSKAYNETSEFLIRAMEGFLAKDVDCDSRTGSLGSEIFFTCIFIEGVITLDVIAKGQAIWGGDQPDFNYVLETQVNLLRQRINETIKLNDPNRKWRGSSEIFPYRVLFTYTLDKE